MTSINIITDNSNLIEAIKAILQLDPKAQITYDDNLGGLSLADAKHLQEISDADDRDEVKYYSFDEMRERSKEHLRKLMKIVFSDKFGNELERILNFIAQDSLNRATEFNDALYDKILEIPSRPYSFRKNKLLK